MSGLRSEPTNQTFNLTRRYDSIAKDRSGAFGFGWTIPQLGINLQTDVSSTGRESLGIFNPFRAGTRIYLTLPDGNRAAFTFTPQKHEQAGVTYYTPGFTADAGVAWTLASSDAKLSRGGDFFYDLNSGAAYNPNCGAGSS